MKNYIKTILLTFMIGFVSSCEDPDNPIYTVLEDYTSGAILRTIELESGEFNSYDLNSFFAATIFLKALPNSVSICLFPAQSCFPFAP